jgi:hypothetical protein
MFIKFLLEIVAIQISSQTQRDQFFSTQNLKLRSHPGRKERKIIIYTINGIKAKIMITNF